MENYKTILIAVDLTKEAHNVARRGKNIAQNALQNTAECKVHMIHVIEPLSYAYGSEAYIGYADLEAERREQAEAQLQKFAARYQVTAAQVHLEVGSAASAIHALAEKLKADLIVIGSHGRSGLALLLGSTANSVLHGAKCDVLAVRVGKD